MKSAKLLLRPGMLQDEVMMACLLRQSLHPKENLTGDARPREAREDLGSWPGIPQIQ
jgi:hypothetical protein